MSQHVWPHSTEPRTISGLSDDVVYRLTREWLAALRYEQPRQAILARREVALDCSQLIAFKRLLGA
jgi:hypothetical protein